MQHLPTYVHAFLEYPEWLTTESEHYIFKYTKGSETEKDIQHIIHTQENAFIKILNFLKVDAPTQKITYYFYPHAETKIKLMGDDWYAQSIYTEFCVHVLYTSEHKPIGPHEDTHLLSLPWGLSWCFLQEGLAEHMVGHSWDGSSHIDKVQEGIKKGMDLRPSTQLSDTDWLQTPDGGAEFYYALAGSWATFIIETYGFDSFKKLYTHTNSNMTRDGICSAYLIHIGAPIDALEEEYFRLLSVQK